MTTHSADALGTLIDSVKPIVSMERDGLVVIALGSTADADGPAYLTLAEAAESQGVDVHELGGGTVPAVEVETKDDPVVIFGGDTIVGGKQNRIVNVTIWLTPHQKTHIPVTCLEARPLGSGRGGTLHGRTQGGPGHARHAQHAGPCQRAAGLGAR